jgi:hypothetical protein
LKMGSGPQDQTPLEVVGGQYMDIGLDQAGRIAILFQELPCAN